MSVPEKLPRLIAAAIAALEKATTAAEILEAQHQADVVYTIAKKAKAHGAVLAACQRAMGDALLIDARAQCRLADEVDAAQQRGEIRWGGNKSKIHNENLAKLEDLGLTGPQIHRARLIRDAEKAKPGAISKMIQQKLEQGEEPTRADIKRMVVKPKPAPQPKPQPKPRGRASDPHKQKIIALWEGGKSNKEIAAEVGVPVRDVHRVIQEEKTRRAGQNDPKPDLSKTAQERLEMAIRQARNQLEREFERRVTDECRRRIEETILPHYNKEYEHYRVVIEGRKGVMDASTFRKIRSCLHVDRLIQLLSIPVGKLDDGLKKRYNEAFDLFNGLEKRLLDEKESPTKGTGLPKTYAEWEEMRRKAQEERRQRRQQSNGKEIRQ